MKPLNTSKRQEGAYCLVSSSLQNLLIQDSEGYRKQYEESIQEKVGRRDQGMMIMI